MLTVSKLLALLPSSWFSDTAKKSGGILYALLEVFANGLDYLSEGVLYDIAQTRISTASDNNLDYISTDFFGTTLPRYSGEADGSFVARIKANLFTEKVTRKGIINAISRTGASVVEVFEPEQDGFFTDYSCTDGCRISNRGPYEAMVFVNRPLRASNTGLLFPDFNYTDYNYTPSEDTNIWTILDSDILKSIEEAKAAGTRIWVVLDPVSVGTTTDSNHASLDRYYLKAPLLPAPPIITFNVSEFNDGSIML